jgi:hypothetical protein
MYTETNFQRLKWFLTGTMILLFLREPNVIAYSTMLFFTGEEWLMTQIWVLSLLFSRREEIKSLYLKMKVRKNGGTFFSIPKADFASFYLESSKVNRDSLEKQFGKSRKINDKILAKLEEEGLLEKKSSGWEKTVDTYDEVLPRLREGFRIVRYGMQTA